LIQSHPTTTSVLRLTDGACLRDKIFIQSISYVLPFRFWVKTGEVVIFDEKNDIIQAKSF